MSPTLPITSGTATINRTLLHTQQFTAHSGGAHARNGNARGLANQSLNSGDSPPPTYDVVVHDISLQRHGFFYHFYDFVSPSFFPLKKCKFRQFQDLSLGDCMAMVNIFNDKHP